MPAVMPAGVVSKLSAAALVTLLCFACFCFVFFFGFFCFFLPVSHMTWHHQAKAEAATRGMEGVRAEAEAADKARRQTVLDAEKDAIEARAEARQAKAELQQLKNSVLAREDTIRRDMVRCIPRCLSCFCFFLFGCLFCLVVFCLVGVGLTVVSVERHSPNCKRSVKPPCVPSSSPRCETSSMTGTDGRVSSRQNGMRHARSWLRSPSEPKPKLSTNRWEQQDVLLVVVVVVVMVDGWMGGWVGGWFFPLHANPLRENPC